MATYGKTDSKTDTITIGSNGKSVGLCVTPRDTDEGLCVNQLAYGPCFTDHSSSITDAPNRPESYERCLQMISDSGRTWNNTDDSLATWTTSIPRETSNNNWGDAQHVAQITSSYNSTYKSLGLYENDNNLLHYHGAYSTTASYRCANGNNCGELLYKNKILPYTYKHGWVDNQLIPTAGLQYIAGSWTTEISNYDQVDVDNVRTSVRYGAVRYTRTCKLDYTLPAASAGTYTDVTSIISNSSLYTRTLLFIPYSISDRQYVRPVVYHISDTYKIYNISAHSAIAGVIFSEGGQ